MQRCLAMGQRRARRWRLHLRRQGRQWHQRRHPYRNPRRHYHPPPSTSLRPWHLEHRRMPPPRRPHRPPRPRCTPSPAPSPLLEPLSTPPPSPGVSPRLRRYAPDRRGRPRRSRPRPRPKLLGVVPSHQGGRRCCRPPHHGRRLAVPPPGGAVGASVCHVLQGRPQVQGATSGGH